MTYALLAAAAAVLLAVPPFFHRGAPSPDLWAGPFSRAVD